MTGFWSFNISECNSSESLERRLSETSGIGRCSKTNYSNQVWSKNDRGGNDAGCCGIDVRANKAKLTNMIIAGFGDR